MMYNYKKPPVHVSIPCILPQASIAFTQAKKHFSSAIEPLEECHREVMQVAERTASLEFEGLKGLSTARVVEILKVVKRSEMKVVFFGRTSNGKSTVINALLKSKVLPSGAGSTTTAICYIKGHSTATEGGFVSVEGSNESISVEVCLHVHLHNCTYIHTSSSCLSALSIYILSCFLQSAQALTSHMQEGCSIQICWSTAQYPMLKGDIVLVDWYVISMLHIVVDSTVIFCSFCCSRVSQKRLVNT